MVIIYTSCAKDGNNNLARIVVFPMQLCCYIITHFPITYLKFVKSAQEQQPQLC
jgi:hypothetical protein